MQFTKIDINNWTRKEYFDHYFGNTPCTYSMTVKLDISKLKKDGKKLYPTLLYGVTTIINRHEEFRTALDENGQVGVFSEMLPCYTVFHKETETFSSIWTEFTADYTEFLQNYQKDIDAFGERMGMSAKPNPPENTFPVSMIPWTSFEGFNLNLKKGYDYLLPIFTFGKYYEEGGKYYIPLYRHSSYFAGLPCGTFETGRAGSKGNRPCYRAVYTRFFEYFCKADQC